MPERTIQKVQRYDFRQGKFSGRHFIGISSETWKTFDLKNFFTTVQCEVNSLLDTNEKPVYIGSEIGFLKPRRWRDLKNRYYHLVLMPDLVRSIGIREGLYIDMILTRVHRFGGSISEIFPKRLVYGVMEIEPKDTSEQSVFGTQGVLIESTFEDNFFAKHVLEINRAYGFRLYNSTLILLRKLFENLLIELLRAKFGPHNIDLFYWQEKGRFHDFAKLVDNLEQNLGTFRPYSSAFENQIVVFLDKFRERSNSAAHSIDEQPNWDYVESLKKDLNYYCEIFKTVIPKLRSNAGT